MAIQTHKHSNILPPILAHKARPKEHLLPPVHDLLQSENSVQDQLFENDLTQQPASRDASRRQHSLPVLRLSIPDYQNELLDRPHVFPLYPDHETRKAKTQGGTVPLNISEIHNLNVEYRVDKPTGDKIHTLEQITNSFDTEFGFHFLSWEGMDNDITEKLDKDPKDLYRRLIKLLEKILPLLKTDIIYPEGDLLTRRNVEVYYARVKDIALLYQQVYGTCYNGIKNIRTTFNTGKRHRAFFRGGSYQVLKKKYLYHHELFFQELDDTPDGPEFWTQYDKCVQNVVKSTPTFTETGSKLLVKRHPDENALGYLLLQYIRDPSIYQPEQRERLLQLCQNVCKFISKFPTPQWYSRLITYGLMDLTDEMYVLCKVHDDKLCKKIRNFARLPETYPFRSLSYGLAVHLADTVLNPNLISYIAQSRAMLMNTVPRHFAGTCDFCLTPGHHLLLCRYLDDRPRNRRMFERCVGAQLIDVMPKVFTQDLAMFTDSDGKQDLAVVRPDLPLLVVLGDEQISKLRRYIQRLNFPDATQSSPALYDKDEYDPS